MVARRRTSCEEVQHVAGSMQARRSRHLQHRQRLLGEDHRAVGDWLLVHVTPGLHDPDSSTATLIFFRNRSDDAEGTLADVVHQTAMYYEDRLKAPGSAA